MYSHYNRAFGNAYIEEKVRSYGLHKIDADVEGFAKQRRTAPNRIIPYIRAINSDFVFAFGKMSKSNGWGWDTAGSPFAGQDHLRRRFHEMVREFWDGRQDPNARLFQANYLVGDRAMVILLARLEKKGDGFKVVNSMVRYGFGESLNLFSEVFALIFRETRV